MMILESQIKEGEIVKIELKMRNYFDADWF